MATRLPPGPQKGITLTEARELQRDTLAFVLQAAKTHGDVVRYPIGFWDVYLVNHPDYIEHIFVDNWQNYGRNTFQFEKFGMVTGEGLLTTHGELWLARRRMVQPGFHRNRLGMMAERMSTAVSRFVARWQPIAQAEGTVDADPELLTLALEVVGGALFGLELGEQAADMSQELLGLMEYVIFRSQNLLAPPAWVPTRRNRRFNGRLHRFDKWLHELIAERVAHPEKYDDLLSMLVQSKYKDGRPLRVDEMRDECATLVIAGYETVASGMAWILYLLGQDTAVREQLRAEVREVTGGKPPTFEQTSQLTQMRRVIDEVFRLYPPSWLITRRALAADKLGEYDLPADALVVVCPYAIHRHRDFWVEPERFDPTRFAPEAVQARHKYAYFPFGGGPHLCLGKHFALLEAQLTLANLLLHFDFELAVPPPIEKMPQVTIRPREGIPLRLKQV